MKKKFTFLIAVLMLLTMMVLPGKAVGQTRDTKTDVMFAKGFGNYTTNSFSSVGTDRSAVANSTNATSVTYAMQVFNGSTGAVRGNQSAASSNFSCRNTSTYDGYYISSVSLTITGTGNYSLDGGTANRSVVYFGTSAYANPNNSAPSGTATSSDENASGQTTLTWTNSDENVSYFILYNLKTAGTCLSESASNPLTVVWTQKTQSSVATPALSHETGTYAGTQSVTITCETAGSSIYYTLDGTAPTSSSTPYTGAISITESKTLKAIAYVGEEASAVKTAVYTILTPLTTMQQIYDENTTSTAKTVAITFGNWVITGNNGGSSPTKAWLTDNNGKGCSLYQTNIGFTANNVLTGTVICELTRFGNSAQISGVTSSTTDINGNGIVASDPGSVTVIENVAISTLGGVNTGSVVQINNLTCTSANTSSKTYVLTDSNSNTITAKNTVYSSLILEEGKVYNLTGVYERNYSTNQIYPRGTTDIVEVVSSDPTINSTPTSLTGFTYSEGSGPSATQTITVSGSNLEGNISLALNDGQDSAFEISLSENSGYSNYLSLTPQSEGSVSATTVYVRLIAGLSIANDYADEINLTSSNADPVTVNLSGTVTGPEVTWNLAEASHTSASTTLVTWSSDYVTMTNAKGTSSTNANNYLGDGSNTHTRFYQNQVLTFTPASGYAISSIEITAVSSYVAGFTGNNWTNATTSTSGTKVTVTPSNINNPCSVVISGACRATAVKVYYTASTLTPHSITNDEDMVNGTVVATQASAVAGATVTLTIYPAAGYYLEDDDDIAAYGSSQITLNKENAGTFTFVMPDEDVTVYAIFSAYTGTYYTLVNSTEDIVPGRHYIIANSKTAGDAKVMSGQNGNFRDAVAAEVIGNTIYETANVREVVLSGDATNHWTLYDDATALTGIGYLYAGNNNVLRGRADNSDNNHLWSISISEGVATIVSEIEGAEVTNTIMYNYNNGTNPRFTTYKQSSGMSLVYLYMKANDTNPTYYVDSPDLDDNPITVLNNEILTLTGTVTNDDPANLVIEDGGQIIVPNTEVLATFKKNVSGYGSSKDDNNPNNDGYKLIAKPTKGNMTLTPGVGMLVNNYDLYYFDESIKGAEWRNYKANNTFTTIDYGTGYLYANSDDIVLNFTGEVPVGTSKSGIELSFTKDNPFEGLNLIGNPLSVNITSMNNNGAQCGYYKLNDDGTFTGTTAAETAIAVGQGFMVQASAVNKSLNLNLGNGSGKGYDNETIRLEVANSKYSDVTYVCFGNMMPLTKINHMNGEAPMLYIHNDNSDDAIAVYNNRGEVKNINVSFEAKELGTYTISAKMVKGDVKYMHLYDRLTGADTDLLEDDYTFIGSKDDNAGRFILKLEASDNEFEGIESFAYQSGDEIFVSGEGELQIFDVTGRMVSTTRINGVETVSGLSQGVYVFRLIGNEIKTQKIVVR